MTGDSIAPVTAVAALVRAFAISLGLGLLRKVHRMMGAAMTIPSGFCEKCGEPIHLVGDALCGKCDHRQDNRSRLRRNKIISTVHSTVMFAFVAVVWATALGQSYLVWLWFSIPVGAWWSLGSFRDVNLGEYDASAVAKSVHIRARVVRVTTRVAGVAIISGLVVGVVRALIV
jgi:hypothetical protein